MTSHSIASKRQRMTHTSMPGEAHPVSVLDVGEPLGFSGVPVHNDSHVPDLACTGEELKELLLGGLQRQIVCKYSAYVPIQLHEFPLPLPLLPHLRWRHRPPAEHDLSSKLKRNRGYLTRTCSLRRIPQCARFLVTTVRLTYILISMLIQSKRRIFPSPEFVSFQDPQLYIPREIRILVHGELFQAPE